MKHLALLWLMGMALIPQAWPLEMNAAGGQNEVNNLEMKNIATIAASKAMMKYLQTQLSGIMGCQMMQKFWNGNDCVGLGVTSYTTTTTALPRTAAYTPHMSGGSMAACDEDNFCATKECICDNAQVGSTTIVIENAVLKIDTRICEPYTGYLVYQSQDECCNFPAHDPSPGCN